jgi:hypothetical protein
MAQKKKNIPHRNSSQKRVITINSLQYAIQNKKKKKTNVQSAITQNELKYACTEHV